MAIGSRIKQLRIDHGIRLETLALASRLSRSTIQDLEAGITLKPHADTVRRLADAFGLMPSDLVGGYDRRLVEEGWWPPERVKSVIEAINACTVKPLTPEESETDESMDLAILKCLLELRRVSGLDEPLPGAFPLLLNTVEEVYEYLSTRLSHPILLPGVRDRPAPVDPPSNG